MKILSGKRQEEMSTHELAERIRGRLPVHIDIGTGSGRMMLKLSGCNPDGFYIGVDPCAKSMQENAVKAEKRGRKTKLKNLLFVVGAVETVPDELAGIADIISVTLPWGSLRDGIVKADPLVLGNLRQLGKPGAALEMLIGYDERLEPHEMEKRSLPVLSQKHFAALTPAFKKAGIEIRSVKTVGNGELKMLESDWAKKLAYGEKRVSYSLECACI